MMLNGGLAGLVAITAPCAFVSPLSAFVIGVVAGVLVVESVLLFDRVGIDDPVGAISVHLVNGIWGTLAVGLFAQPFADLGEAQPKPGLFIGGSGEQFIVQLIGVASVGAFAFTASLLAWAFIKVLVGLRVEPEEEVQGLDIGEMGMEAYSSDPFPTFEALSVTGWERFIPTFAHQPAQVIPTTTEASSLTVKREPSIEVASETAHTPSVERRLYSIILENANTERAKRRWERLCHEPQQAPPEFHEVYRHLVSFDGREFVFRGGDPERMRKAVERLFEGYLGVGAKVTVEMSV